MTHPIKYGFILFLLYCFGHSFVYAEEPVRTDSAQPAKEKVSIQLKWMHQFQFAGYYAAIEKGYYDDENLSVELIEKSSALSTVEDVVNGKAHYGVTGPDIVLAAQKGKPVVLLLQLFQHSPLVLITRKDSGLRNVFDLVDKKVTISTTGVADTPILAMLEKHLGGVDQVHSIPHTFRYDDLIEKKTDAVAAYVTNEPFYYEKKGLPINIIDPRDYGIDFYGDNLFTTQQEILYHPQRVERLIRATLKGWEYALKNPLEVIEIILEKYNTQNLTREQLFNEAKELGNIILPDFYTLGSFYETRYEKIAQTYQQLGFSQSSHIPSNFFYNKKFSSKLLNSAEKDYLKQLSEVRVPIVDNQPPLTFLENQQAKGYLNDLLKLVAQRLAIKIKPVYGMSYRDSLEALKDGKVDLLNDYSIYGHKRDYALHTAPVLKSPFVVVGRNQSDPVRHLQDLAGKRLVLVAGFQQTRAIQQQRPNFNIQLVGDINQAYSALRSKDADYYIDNASHAGYYLQTHMISDLTILGELPTRELAQLSLHFAASAQHPLLHSAIEKALSSISPKELNDLRENWAIDANKNGHFELSIEEKQWLKQHQNIRVIVDPSWAPVEYVDHLGNFQGISIDYLNKVSERIGVRFSIAKNANWSQGVQQFKNKKADIVSSMAKTTTREKFGHFTKPYISMPVRIFARKDYSYIGNLRNLRNKKVAVVKGFAVEEWIKRDFPDFNLIAVKTPAIGLDKVSNGTVDAFIGNVVASTYYLGKLDIDNIRIAGDTPYTYAQTMAVRKDWPILAGIIQKALDTISPQEHDEIFSRWMSIRFEHTVNYQLLWLVIILAAIFLSIAFYWNRVLNKQVKLRTQELADREQILTTVINEIPDMLVLKDNNGNFKLCNKTVAKLYNTTPEQMIGKSDEDYGVPKEMSDFFRQNVLEIIEKGETTVVYEDSQDIATGEIRHFKSIKNPFKDINGENQILIIAHDITDIVSAQKQVAESEKKLSTILDNLDAFIYLKDKQRKYLFANRSLRDFWQTDMDEILGCSDEKFFNPKTAQYLKTNDNRVLKDGETVHTEETDIVTLNGQTATYLTTKLPLIDEKGEIYALCGISIDITQRKAIELALLESNKQLADERNRANELTVKAEAASQAKSAFLANMSHEIRTPLNGIIGVCQILQDTPINPEQKDLLDTMNNSGNSLIGIINDILDFSKIESGKLVLDNSSFDLSETINNVIQLLLPSAAAKRIKLLYQAPESSLLLKGDATRLTQVLTNLVGNAIKFTHQGQVSVKVHINQESDKKVDLTVTISDTGIGISNEKLKSIFEEFSQADVSTTRKYGGTGLGLSISQKLIKLMGGELKVESEISQGSSFTFSLTLKKAKKTKKVKTHSSTAKPHRNCRVLLVEDDQVNRMIAKKMLSGLKCEIITANNGEEALQELKQNRYDIIFMDVQMPIMDGLEATRQIRRDDQESIIIAMTANAMNEDKEKCLNSGMNDFIPKPIKTDELSRILEKWLAKQS